MREDYWIVEDSQVIEKTGKGLAYWTTVLIAFDAANRKASDVVNHLQNDHGIPRYWARTLTTRFAKGLR